MTRAQERKNLMAQLHAAQKRVREIELRLQVGKVTGALAFRADGKLCGMAVRDRDGWFHVQHLNEVGDVFFMGAMLNIKAAIAWLRSQTEAAVVKKTTSADAVRKAG